MKKAECETAIRQLVHDWAKTQDQTTDWHPIFSDFQSWLDACGYGHYLKFRSGSSALDDAERWFDSELKQNWRN